MTLEEIEQQLTDIKNKESELQRMLIARREEQKAEVAEQIRDLIAEHGYKIAEILPLIENKRKRGGSPVRAESGERQYTRYIDPQNPDNVYVRGVLPGWMKTQMTEQGYDPASKADREAFKANYLQSVRG
nr:H-NS histone family protein [Thiocapsa imhoffii]